MKNKFLRLMSVVLVLVIVLSSMTISALAADFADLNGHWGYDYVMTLVNDGTVNGYPDGTFRPDGTVTRAEFVKLIGKTDVLYDGTYSDIAEHWGYDYIMYSGLDGYEDGTFKPDTPITRNDCVNLIWKRNGAIKGIICPSAITNQGTNPDAVAWAYTNGIVCGDDGFNLRLSDTLTRAEAATLIVRSRNIDPNAEKVRFIDRVKPELLQVVYESFNLFENKAYNPDATITNGELARAVLSYGEMTSIPEYGGIAKTPPYDGKYARDMETVSKECMQDVPLNVESENSNASVKHALSELMFNTLKRTGGLKSGKGTPYSDLGTYEGNLDMFLKYAYKNGIYFDSTGNIYPDSQITLKQFSLILLQLDELYGSQLAYKNDDKTFLKINKNLSSYPGNYKDYRTIIEGVSQKAYIEFKPETSVLDYNDNAHSSAFVIGDTLDLLKKKYEEKGFNFDFTCYATLICENNSRITFLVKVESNAPEGTMATDVFGDIFYSSRNADLSGDNVYFVMKTDTPFVSFFFMPEDLKIIDVIS